MGTDEQAGSNGAANGGRDASRLRQRVPPRQQVPQTEMLPAKLLENTEAQARAFRALHELAVAAGGVLDPAALAKLAVDHARDLLGVDAASLFWWDPEVSAFRWLAHNDPHRSGDGPTLRPGEGATGLAFERRQPVIVENYRDWDHALDWPAAREALTVAAVPLLVADRAVGVLVVRTYTPHHYEPEQIQLLSLLAAQVGPTLATARLYAESERQRVEAEALAELARQGAAEPDADRVVSLITEQACTLLDADYAGLALKRRDGTLVWRGVWGNRTDVWFSPMIRMPIGKGSTGRALAAGRTVILERLGQDANLPREEFPINVAEGGRTVLATPLFAPQEALGVLVIGWRSDVTLSGPQVQLAEALASYAATILDNARARAEVAAHAEELAASEKRYRTLYQALACGVLVQGRDGEIIDANRVAEESLGLTLDEMCGHTPEALLEAAREDGSHLPETERPGRLALHRRSPVRNYTINVIRPDGERRWFQGNAIPVLDEDGQPKQVVSTFLDITERKQAENRLRESQTRLKLLNNIAISMTSGMSVERIIEDIVGQIGEHFPYLRVAYSTIDTQNTLVVIHSVQPSTMPSIAGLQVDLSSAPEYLEALRRRKSVIVEDIAQESRLARLADALVRNGTSAVLDIPLHHSDRLVGLLCFDSPEPHKWNEHEITTLTEVGQYLSITLREAHTQQERQQTEEVLHHREAQLLQAKKMEAMGRLAGGIAHDFNNLLTVITGYSDLLLMQLPPNDTFRADVEKIAKAGEHAAALTNQLLAFSRRQMLTLKVLDLNAVVAETEDMLRRLIGEDIELLSVLSPGLGRVKADQGQIQQVILNLAVNARDAMLIGGRLTLQTANVELAEPLVHPHGIIPSGSYVMLAVHDTGCGMDEETQSHIFEPFFTTKAPGKGTGLGLSTVYGVVQQSGAYIALTSAGGQGTTFRVYFPRVEDPLEISASRIMREGLPTGTESVLLVEDDAQVRTFVRGILEGSGYTVWEASRGDEALRILETQTGPIHLLVTDVVMPGMSGPELAQYVASLCPDVHVLYISGYPDDAIMHHTGLEADHAFLPKPFTPPMLLRKVRQVLDARPAG